MDYKYLVTYFKEPIAIADTEIQALTAIRDDIRLHQTNRQDYDFVALRYYHENKNSHKTIAEEEDAYYKTLSTYDSMRELHPPTIMCSEE